MKRTISTALWGYAFWYLGATLASIFNAPEAFGPILGVAAALLVAVDPRGHFWAKPSAERTATPTLSMTTSEATR